jgi:hypothetical protein
LAFGPLGLWLELDTHEEEVTLRLSRILLIVDGQTKEMPTSFIGPETTWESPRAAGMGCGPRRYALGWSVSKIDISVVDIVEGNVGKGVRKPTGKPSAFKGKKCFMLFFDTDPGSDRNFILSIQEIRRHGELIHIPEMLFRKGLVKKVFPIP